MKDQSEDGNRSSSGVASSDKKSIIAYVANYDTVFLSLNRYERKKNITLAIDALQDLKSSYEDSRRVVLVVAGGYDLSVPENTEYLVELMSHCEALQIPFTYTPDKTKISETNDFKRDKIESNAVDLKPSAQSAIEHKNEKPSGKEMVVHVVFRTSISGLEREALLERADALLYTPDRCEPGPIPGPGRGPCTTFVLSVFRLF